MNTTSKSCGLDDLEKILRPGDAFVTKSSGLPTALIRWFTDSEYTHAECYAGKVLDKSVLVGAGPVFGGVFSKVRIIPLSAIKSDFVVMRPMLPLSDNESIARFMLQHLEAEYGYLEYIPIAYRIALRFLNKQFGLSLKVPTKDSSPSEWVCSELYAAGCEYANVVSGKTGSFWGTEPINVYPCHIVDSNKMVKIASRDGDCVTFFD
jgi:hypothetical protein